MKPKNMNDLCGELILLARPTDDPQQIARRDEIAAILTRTPVSAFKHIAALKKWRADAEKVAQARRESALRCHGECSWCKKRRVLVTCSCRACDRLEADGRPRWRVCRKCALEFAPK